MILYKGDSMKSKLFLLLLNLIVLTSSSLAADTMVIKDLSVVEKQIQNFKKDALVFFINDELFEPSPRYVRIENVELEVIPLIPNTECVDLIRKIQQSDIKIVGITNTPNNIYDFDPTLSNWYIDALKMSGVDFSISFPNKDFALESVSELETSSSSDDFENLFTSSESSGTVVDITFLFKKGILFPGSEMFEDAVRILMKNLNHSPSQVIVISKDDYEINKIEDIFGSENVLGFHYKPAKIQKEMNEKLLEFQLRYLFDHKKWLSEEEAILLMN